MKLISFSHLGHPELIVTPAHSLLVRPLVAGLTLMLAGCAQLHSPALTGIDDDVTGSIPISGSPSTPPSIMPLSSQLTEEDWHRAQASLSEALDPAGDGMAVSWDNPASKAKGQFIPTAPATVAGGRTCRPFHAELSGSLTPEKIDGLGCHDNGGEWIVTQIDKAKSPRKGHGAAATKRLALK